MKRRYMLILEILLLAGLAAWVFQSMTRGNAYPDAVDMKIQLSNANDKALLVKESPDKIVFIITDINGKEERLNPDQFANRVYSDKHSRSWLATVLNVSSPVGFIWVGLGLLGQVLFTGRMIVQWLVSEKEKKSVVPPIFWWMSLIGSTMLLVYFMWRRDPVGLLGQAFGWFIYIRNIWMIYGRKDSATPAEEDAADLADSQTLEKSAT